MTDNPLVGAIFRFLRDNSHRYVPAKELAALFRINERTLRDKDGFIAQARKLCINGVEIISGSEGYKMSSNAKEIAAWSGRLKKHGASEITTTRKAESRLAPDQSEMPL